MKINRLPELALFSLLALTSLSAYKSGHFSTPDMADRVAGQYTLTQVSLDGKTYSAQDAGVEGNVSISRQNASQVYVTLKIANAQAADVDVLNGSLTNITLTDMGNNDVELRNGTIRFGRVSADKLTINGKHENEVLFTLVPAR